MIVLRKLFSGYQSMSGVSYVDSGVGVANTVIDDTDAILDWAEKTPVINKLPNKKKKLFRSYTKPLRRLINNNKN